MKQSSTTGASRRGGAMQSSARAPASGQGGGRRAAQAGRRSMRILAEKANAWRGRRIRERAQERKIKGKRRRKMRRRPDGVHRRGEEEAGVHREASMALVCSCEESKERDEVRGEPEREKGGCRERENQAARAHLLVMLVGGGRSGGAVACRARRTAENGGKRGKSSLEEIERWSVGLSVVAVGGRVNWEATGCSIWI